MIFAIPIAWLQLIHQKARFVVTLLGIAFVAILLFIQLGFQDALFESSVRLHKSLKGDLFLVSSQYQSLTLEQRFPRNRLYQTLASDAVESVIPLYTQFGKIKNIETGQKYIIFVFGIDPGNSALNLDEVDRQIDQLKFSDRALFDRDSRPEFGPVVALFDNNTDVEIELFSYENNLNAERFKVGGLFSLGTSFGIDGNIIVNYLSFLRAFGGAQADDINIGIINLKDDGDPEQVRRTLQKLLPEDVKILTLPDFIKMEKDYWNLRTPIGFVFRTMVVIGFLVGTGVSYQILYSNVSMHIKEYATLKAMGFKPNYLSRIVFNQALILAILGFIPGLIISVMVYDIAEDATKLPVVMTPLKIALVFFLVTSICTLSGVLAVQKIRSADPADVF
ncbi:ABC transporter permease DevC [Oscillatoria sp. CS-180]|uniref:ABC transporter permease DevC n=1 Tax=Oscillatoria sp. CS-180 TaxID=3021720 RepID=UPI0023300FDF|nr:ABC transporter permease DevC [Oscillatoria sp. CS-180]MDB9526149.1 ABC transporter permease DevC [Oscillatoria sp. CS-180]